MAGKGRKKKDLYRIKIVDEDGDKVKVHFIGYSKNEDEWMNKEDVIVMNPSPTNSVPTESDSSFGSSSKLSNSCSSNELSEHTTSVWRPLSPYNELGNKIKAALKSTRKESPSVRIDMSFDQLLFSGGLARLGTKKRVYFGRQRYSLVCYSDLDPLLGTDEY